MCQLNEKHSHNLLSTFWPAKIDSNGCWTKLKCKNLNALIFYLIERQVKKGERHEQKESDKLSLTVMAISFYKFLSLFPALCEIFIAIGRLALNDCLWKLPYQTISKCWKNEIESNQQFLNMEFWLFFIISLLFLLLDPLNWIAQYKWA